jgi:glycosyltransferase involved in cell wall biosynthesis
MSLTVVIPCYKRPNYLITSLESVSRQTALRNIEKIIVSENSEDESSRIVCEKFPQLPIKYVKQPKTLSAVQHLDWIIQQSESEFTAMLHDDDWWYPTHLETGLENLMSKNIVSYYSNFIFTNNEILKKASFHYPSFITYLLGNRKAFESIELSILEVSTLCYLYTPFHMSSMICHTKTLKEASLQSLKLAKPFYADRILYPFISQFGKVAFNPQILCAIRLHEANDGKSIHHYEKLATHKEGSDKIQELATRNNISVINEWMEVKNKLTNDEWMEIIAAYDLHFGKTEDKNSLFYIKPQRKFSFLYETAKKIFFY